MRCPRCGAVLRDDAEQCGFCGEKIVPAVSFEKPIIENRPRDEAFDVENTVQPEVPQQQQNHDQNQSNDLLHNRVLPFVAFACGTCA